MSPIEPHRALATAVAVRRRALPWPRHALAPALALGFALLAFGAPTARAQPDVVPLPAGARITAVRVQGGAARFTAVRDLGIPVGAPLSRALVRDAIARLIATGRYRDVQIDAHASAGGVELIVRVEPRLLLLRVDVRGNTLLDDAQIIRLTTLTEGQEIDAEATTLAATRIREDYASRGYEDAVVDISVRPTREPSERVVAIQIREGDPTEIDAIVLEGDPLPRTRTLRALLRIEVGEILDRAAITTAVERAQASLRENGYFEASLGPARVERAEGRTTVRIPSHVGPRYHIAVDGPEPLSESEVAESLDLGEEPLRRALIPTLEARVVERYRAHGFADARVRIRRTRGPRPGLAWLLIDVVPGPTLEVIDLRFDGASHFSQRFLRGQVATYLEEALGSTGISTDLRENALDALVEDRRGTRPDPRSAPEVIPPERVWHEGIYERAIEHIRDLYRAEGYMRVRIHAPEISRDERGRAKIAIRVEEGPRARVYELVIVGNDAVPDEVIASAAALERQAPFSRADLEQARTAVLEVYQERGYLFAEVRSEVRYSEDGTRAAIELRIRERYPVYVGEIRFVGLEATREGAARAQLALVPGELFRPSLARRTQERLMDLGVFASVNVQPVDADVPERLKDIVVTVAERPSQYLDFRAGVSTAEGVRGAFEYGYRNLFGSAVQLSFRAQLASQILLLNPSLADNFEGLSVQDRLERRVTANLLVPYLPRFPDASLSFNLLHQRDNERRFGLDRNGGDITLSYRPSRTWLASVSTGIENNSLDILSSGQTYEQVIANATPQQRRILRVPEGGTTIVAVDSRFQVDRRDNPFNPTRGFYGALGTEWARSILNETVVDPTGESIEFFSHHLRITLTANGYARLGRGVVLANQVRFGRMVHLANNSETYPNRQFFIGGVDTMRAYRQDAMIPQDIADEFEDDEDFEPNAVAQGGDVFGIARSELRFPIAGDLRGGFFAEFGNLWSGANEFNPFEFRPTLGIGIRYATPVGPIAIDYGINLLHNRAARAHLDEAFGAFHFSIGLF